MIQLLFYLVQFWQKANVGEIKTRMKCLFYFPAMSDAVITGPWIYELNISKCIKPAVQKDILWLYIIYTDL